PGCALGREGDQRCAASSDRLVKPRRLDASARLRQFVRRCSIHGSTECRSRLIPWLDVSALQRRLAENAGGGQSVVRRAAAKPERIAPSIVAGKPVST